MITDQKSNTKIVGVYVIGNTNDPDTCIALSTGFKPNWFRRFSTWLFIGWTWMSIADAKEKKIIK